MINTSGLMDIRCVSPANAEECNCRVAKMAMGEVNIVRQNGWLAQERFI